LCLPLKMYALVCIFVRKLFNITQLLVYTMMHYSLIKKRVRFLLFLPVLSFLCHHCVQPPDYPVEPVIAFKSLSKNQIPQRNLGTDSIAISFSFTDGDGDLGFEDNENSIFLTDTRDNVEKLPYSIPFVGLQGVGNGISGDITVVFANNLTCCIYPVDSGRIPCDTSFRVPDAFDTLSFKIRIKDRAGHFSNTIETTPIYLKCKK